MKYRLIEKTEAVSTAQPARSSSYKIADSGCDSFNCMAIITVDTPSAKTFAAAAVNTTTDRITITAHGFNTGLKGQVSNPGTLPTGITAATDYFVIVIDADTIQLASSLANAIAGTAVDITGQGSGTNTFTPTALAGGTIKFQQSNDGSNWADLGSAINVTATGPICLSADRPTSKYIAVYITLTAGNISASLQMLGRGDRDA